MKLNVSYGATRTTQLNISPRPESTALETTLQQLRKDSRWRKFVVGTFLLFDCMYAAVLVVSEYDCSLNSVSSCSSGDASSACCKPAAWSNSVNLPRSTTWTLVNGSTTSIQGGSGLKGTTVDRIIFGIGGSAALWAPRKDYMKLWWKPGLTRGFLWDHNLETWEKGDPPYKISEDTSRIGYTNPLQKRSALRISRIVAESYRLHLPNWTATHHGGEHS